MLVALTWVVQPCVLLLRSAPARGPFPVQFVALPVWKKARGRSTARRDHPRLLRRGPPCDGGLASRRSACGSRHRVSAMLQLRAALACPGVIRAVSELLAQGP